jgi:hypothetical protein
MSPFALHTRDTAHWRALVTAAEASVQSCLENELESYLVMVLLRFAAQERAIEEHGVPVEQRSGDAAGREQRAGELGDRCLVIAGLMPDRAQELGMSMRQVVEIGRNAYREEAQRSRNPLFRRLAEQFVVLMDVLQVMRTLDADVLIVDLFRIYDQWRDTGSQYAFRVLRTASDALPVTYGNSSRH